MGKQLKKLFKKQGFTLVELIIVIAIIAVLAVAAFMLLTKWLANSRDSRRLGDVSTIKKALSITFVEKPYYPEPDEKSEVLDEDGITMWYQGVFGSGVIQNIDNIQKAPIDPSDGSYFRYSVTTDQKEYQIGAILEKGEEASILNKTLAASLVASIDGDYDGYATYSSGGMTYIVQTPSLLLYSGSSLNTSGDNSNLMINGEELGTEYGMRSVGFTGNPADLAVTVRDTFGLTGGNADNLAVTIVKNNSRVTPSAITYDSCEFQGTTIAHGGSATRYEAVSVRYDQICVSETRTCNNGTMSTSSNNYTETSCSIENAANCPEETINSYIVGATNHGATYDATKEEIGFTNGTKILAQSYECTDGNFATTGGETTDSITCNTNYVESGGACVEDECGNSIPTYGESNATSQSYGTDWIYNLTPGVCTYKCNEGYENASCTAKTTQVTTADYNGTEYDYTEFTLTYGIPLTGTSLVENITNGTAILEALFTLGTDGTTVTLSSQVETITCDTNYTLNGGVCDADTQIFTCSAKPNYSVWNTVSEYTQTWNGTEWLPQDSSTEYNLTGSITSCNYKCETDYHTEDSGTTCISDISSCTISHGLGSKIWDGSDWGDCTIDSCEAGYTATIDSCQKNSLMENIVGYWDFDETTGTTINDKLGNGNNLNLGSSGVWMTGKVGGAGHIVNGRVTNTGKSFAGSANTISFWFKFPDTSDTTGGFIAFENTATPDKEDNLGQSYSTYGSNVCAAYADQRANGMSIRDTDWHFYSISKGVDTIVCVDGNCQSTGVDSTLGISNPNSITLNGGIGCGYGSFTQGFLMDELRIFSLSYSKSQLELLYTDSTGSGVTIVDYSGAKRWSNGTSANNCKTYFESNSYNNEGSGIYWIHPDSSAAIQVYCDMTTDGGGWTLVGENHTGGLNVSEAVGTVSTSPTDSDHWKLSDTLINKIKSNTSSTINGYRIDYDTIDNKYYWVAACVFDASSVASANYCNNWSVYYDQVATYDGGGSSWYGLARRKANWGNMGWSAAGSNVIYPCYTDAFNNGECTHRYSEAVTTSISNIPSNLWVR